MLEDSGLQCLYPPFSASLVDRDRGMLSPPSAHLHSAFPPQRVTVGSIYVHSEQLQHSYAMPLDTVYLTRHGVCALCIHLLWDCRPNHSSTASAGPLTSARVHTGPNSPRRQETQQTPR